MPPVSRSVVRSLVPVVRSSSPLQLPPRRVKAKVPDAANTEVEVRPVLDMSGWEF